MTNTTSTGSKGLAARVSVRPARVAQGALVAAFTTFRIILAYKTPLSVNTGAAVDDWYFLERARCILDGSWLGSWNPMLLIKDAGYPLFIAILAALHIPYQLGLIGLHTAAAAASGRCVRPLVRTGWLPVALYLLVLWMPPFLSWDFFSRLYRNGIVLDASLFLAAGLVGLVLRAREGHARPLVPWALVAGLGLGLVMTTKEDGIWAVPVVAVGCVLAAVLVWRHAKRKAGAIVTCLVPVGIGALCVCALSLANLGSYGIFAQNDLYEGSFGRVKAALVRIDAEDNRDVDVWVSRKSLDMALKASPTLASIKDQIATADAPYLHNEAGEVVGDHWFWGLRSALEASGRATDEPAMQDFWAAVASELEHAFETGELAAKPGLSVSSSIQPIPTDQLWHVFASSLKTTAYLATNHYFVERCSLPASAIVFPGDPARIEQAEEILGPRVYAADANGLVEDDVSRAARPWLVISGVVGSALSWLTLALTVAEIPLLAIALVRGRKRLGEVVAPLVMVLALAATEFAHVVAAGWAMGFTITDDLGGWLVAQPGYAGPVFALHLVALGLVYACVVRLLASSHAAR